MLPDELFDKLARGAAQRGLTIETLLAFVSEWVVPNRPTGDDQERSRRIERLLAKYSAGSLKAHDRAELDNLIDADYQAAAARADRLIAAGASRATAPRNAKSPAPHGDSSRRAKSRLRK
jgi:hypothetical protein